MANSSMLVLPSSTASACCSRDDDVGVVGRHEVLQHLAAAGGRLAAGAEHVLDGHGHAGEQAERFAAAALAIDGAGLLQGFGLVDVQKSSDLRLALANGLQELRRSRYSAVTSPRRPG